MSKPVVIILGEKEEITKEMLEKYISEAYEKGYEDGRAQGWVSPTIPPYWTSDKTTGKPTWVGVDKWICTTNKKEVVG